MPTRELRSSDHILRHVADRLHSVRVTKYVNNPLSGVLPQTYSATQTSAFMQYISLKQHAMHAISAHNEKNIRHER